MTSSGNMIDIGDGVSVRLEVDEEFMSISLLRYLRYLHVYSAPTFVVINVKVNSLYIRWQQYD